MAFFRHDFRPKRERTNRFSKKTWIWHTWFALAGHKKKMHLAPREALSLTRALNRRKTLPLKSKIHMIKYWYDLLTLAFMRRETEQGEENEVATLWGKKKMAAKVRKKERELWKGGRWKKAQRKRRWRRLPEECSLFSSNESWDGAWRRRRGRHQTGRAAFRIIRTFVTQGFFLDRW